MNLTSIMVAWVIVATLAAVGMHYGYLEQRWASEVIAAASKR